QELMDFGTADQLGDEDSHRLWREVAEVASLVTGDGRVVWRISVPPTTAPDLVAHLARSLDLRHLFDWGGGLIWLAVAGAEDGGAAVIRDAIAGHGHATLIRAPDGLRAAVPVFQPLAPALAALTARVKESFDPKRILNRGRMY